MKTVNEFAYVQNKMLTTNPVDTNHRPGVSSTGSGAAVADFQCHVGIGTQTVSPLNLLIIANPVDYFNHSTGQLLWYFRIQANVSLPSLQDDRS